MENNTTIIDFGAECSVLLIAEPPFELNYNVPTKMATTLLQLTITTMIVGTPRKIKEWNTILWPQAPTAIAIPQHTHKAYEPSKCIHLLKSA
jgi:hypothetical protein